MNESNGIDDIEKTAAGYHVTVDGSTRDLKEISDVAVLRPHLGFLLYKEFRNWDSYCNGC